MTTVLKKLATEKSLQITLVLVLFFLSEAVTKIAYHAGLSFHNYSALIKGAFIVFAVVFAIFNLTKNRKQLLLFLIGMSVFFIVGQYTFNNNQFGLHFLDNLIFFSRYVLVFIISLVFIKGFKAPSNSLFFEVYEKIIIFNSLLIILGVVFKIPFFQTYSFRFGYNGLFMVPSISTFFYALALTYFTNRFLHSKDKTAELILVSIICFLVGTKALLLFFLLTALHVFIVKKMYRNKWFYIVSFCVLIVGFLFRKYIFSIVSSIFKTIFSVYKEHGLITALTSYRNEKLQDNFVPLIEEKWSWVNYLFGGTDFVPYRVEFELFDVFLFFGIIGTIVYLFFYFKHIIKFKYLIPFGRVQMVFLLFIAMLSGTFFNNAPVALYLLIVLGSLQVAKREF